MTERVYLHVGTPKSGTTFLQGVLRHNARALRRQGVLVAGRTHLDLVHAGMVVRNDSRLDRLPERARGAWDRVVAEVLAFEGHTAVVSYELFAGASRRQAARAIAAFGGLEVHVVVTTRDLGRTISSAWQERLKFDLAVPLEEWRPPPVRSGPGAHWGWRTLDPGAVATRWGASLPPERVHIVTSPRSSPSDPGLLWKRFAEACTLGGIDVETDVAMNNESLGVKASEVLRRVNTHDLGPITGPREQARWLRDVLAHQVLAGLDSEPMTITEDQLARARRRADDAVATIRAAGWQVHGSLDDLSPTRRDARLPSQVPAEELLEVATQAIVSLLLELRGVRQVAAASDPRSRARRELARAAARVRGRRAPSRVDELELELVRLRGEAQASRRLHEQVAALTDLVMELLVPADQQSPASLRKSLKTYRQVSL